MSQPIPKSEQTLIIRPAELSDLTSLKTIVPRSFFPSNLFVQRCFPDTPSVREYWTEVFQSSILNPDCHLLVAATTSSSSSAETLSTTPQVIAAVLSLRLLDSTSKGAGFWTMFPISPDGDRELFQPAIDFMTEFRERTFMREGEGGGGRRSGEGRHLMVELFGVDQEFQGLGLGRKLLVRAGEIADEEGIVSFVQANGGAAGMYAKMGFEEKERAAMPGDLVYEECLMIRPCRRRNEGDVECGMKIE